MIRYLWQPSLTQQIGLYPDGSIMQTCKTCAHSSHGGKNRNCPFHPIVQKIESRPGLVQVLNPCTMVTCVYKESAVVPAKENNVSRTNSPTEE
jgi:hypothetical protein